MSLETGARLGRYEIRGLLGRGGMGEVYLALDSQLDRQVALKVLPAEVAGDADRVRRFEREAKAASALESRAAQGEYIMAASVAQLYLRLDEVEAAFDWLAKAGHQPSRLELSLGVDPIYDSIRGDPRFVELLRRIGLPPNPLGVDLARGDRP